MPDHPWPIGTRVYHVGQEWHRTHMGGTATVEDFYGPLRDGSYEYKVRTGEDFSRRTSKENPETRECQWSSFAVRKVENGDALSRV